ncbi:MAG: DUF4838 domain-containing protein [Kiritimatiellae bacterium]|nr:DUF4838 domain-containing protein [Kiritimatiellia bacterium]MDD5520300.1 DUF4838 domain-containing protein [Kiritimatiellia bacterium]
MRTMFLPKINYCLLSSLWFWSVCCLVMVGGDRTILGETSGLKITIVVPFAGAERETPVWAQEEESIDFRHDHQRATRCTSAFAAMELKHYLVQILRRTAIIFSSKRPDSGLFIELCIVAPDSRVEKFSFTRTADGLIITGQNRISLLYGVYELLRLQGWRWYGPGKSGEIVPEPLEQLRFPPEKKEFVPSLPLARGFDFEGVSKESAELTLWMVRNRMNTGGFRPNTGALARKMGLSMVSGGHIFEDILNPNRVLSSGKTLWETHENWYGLPANGKRVKGRALGTQFCMSQPELFDFLGGELLNHLRGEWKEADRVYVWGFDTWGSCCTCEECKKLGNGTDQMLFFMSAMRRCINQARQEGRLDHDVQIGMCCYEGTSTIQGPGKPVPSNLLEKGDYGVFYPINRCYAHDFADKDCVTNAFYNQALQSYFNQKPAVPMVIGEYYNVSKWEDLPLLFTTRIRQDLPAYRKIGASGITYMHVPLVNWGMRTLTQSLYAQLAWDATTDVDAFLAEYFSLWYGPYTGEMRRVYGLIEEAWLDIAEWRSWARTSALSQLLSWNGAKPAKPLVVGNHIKTSQTAVEHGRRSLRLMREAQELLDAVRTKERTLSQVKAGIQAVAVNPAEARAKENAARYEWRLGEDRRLLRYGIDTMDVMTALVAYHDALYSGDADGADKAWLAVEAAADRLDAYYIPISFEQPGAGLVSRDALTRSQTRDIIRRCRVHRSVPRPE